MSDKYILDESGNPVVEPDLLKWARWYETADRNVALDRIGKVRVSTVFLGLDQSLYERTRSILFETMVFGGSHDGEQFRYATRDEALSGHQSIVAQVKDPDTTEISL